MSSAALRVLVVTGGHPFDQDAFFAAFAADDGICWAHAAQPAARRWLRPEEAGRWDAIVFYDMPGVGFRPGGPPQAEEPPPSLVSAMGALLDAGQGVVFLHHAIAAWPAWDEYARWVGGRFHYRPARLEGIDWPDSGYAFDMTHTVTPLIAGHPVSEGLESGLTLTDELYLAPVLEDLVTPLLRSDAVFDDGRFASAAAAVAGRRDNREGWAHPSGSPLVGWLNRARRSPVVYLQPGDGPSAYGNPGWRRLLGNAIRWVASAEAHAWATDGQDPAARSQ